MAPKTTPADTVPVPTRGSIPAATRVYRSNQRLQQVRFPGRKKVANKYGRYDTARSPKQRTLTQIGYAIPPLSDLRELDALDQELEVDGLDASQVGSPAKDHATPYFSTRRDSKRRKTQLDIPEPDTTKASFHTQTLTQLVPKQAYGGSRDGSNDFGCGTTIRDSEDEDEDHFTSPSAEARIPASAQKQRGEVLTSRRRRANDLRATPNLMSTPKATRTEIPSSQPSPFTPMLLLDRYYSPLDRQRSSPLSKKQQSPASPSILGRASQTKPTKDNRTTDFPKHSTYTMPDSPAPANSPSQNQSPLRALSFQEIAKRSAPQGSGNYDTIAEEVIGVSAVTRLSRPASGLDPSLGIPRRSRENAYASEEIPDSDEEEDGLSSSYSLNQTAASATQRAGLATYDLAVDSTSSPLSSPLSSAPSPEPGSPTPLPKMRETMCVGSSSLRHHKLDAHAGRSSVSPRSGLSWREKIDDSTHPRPIARHQTSSSAGHFTSSQLISTQQQYSQALESQRVSLDTIRSLGPQTDRSDILISMHPEQIRKIVSGAKDHEFRNFKIPYTVSRFWIYATRPVCELQYMAVVAAGFRQPGEINSNSGIGNAQFNAGGLFAKFAYELVQVYQLNNPVSFDVMKKNGWVGPPQRYDYLPPAVVGALLGNLRCALFGNVGGPGTGDDDCEGQKGGCEDDQLSVSQEIEAQLLSDIAETQASQRQQPRALSSSPDQNQEQPAAAAADRPTRPCSGRTPPHPCADDSQAKDGTKHPALPLGAASMTRPSQATTATAPSTKETSGKGKSRMQDVHPLSPSEHAAAISRPELDFKAWSVPSAKDVLGEKKGARGADVGDIGPRLGSFGLKHTLQLQKATLVSQERPRLSQQGPSLQTALASSTDSTQIVLPDSLYEEVRQAPPAVILDSEESDGER